MRHQESANRPEPSSSEPAPFIVRGEYLDFDQFVESVRDWRLDFRQLDRGAFSASVFQAGDERVQIGRARFNRRLHQQGDPPLGMRTLVIPGDDRQKFEWRGQRITSNRLMMFPSAAELESFSRPGFHIFTLSIDEELLEEMADALELPRLDEMLGGSEVVELATSTMGDLRRRTHEICHAVETAPEWLSDTVHQSELGSRLPIQLLLTIAAAGGFDARLGASQKKRALKRAFEFLAERTSEPVGVAELCQATEVSQRTLSRAFLEEFGMPPGRYLKAIRLQGVRQQLRSTGGLQVKIFDIANQWGFWHMGQFAADYRRQFGELPSATLLRRRGGGLSKASNRTS